MPEPRISVIIPVHNTEALLDRTLDSLARQTLRDIEVLCVDDGSTDGSLAILNGWAQRDPRIRVIAFPQNRGVAAARNAGFAGSWLTQDDYTMSWTDLDTLSEGFEIVGCGDFDGDGVDDVLLKKGSYYGAWLVEDGSVRAWMGLGDLGDVTVEQIGDFDGDGIDDLRIRTADGDLGAMLVKGEDDLVWHYYGSVGSEWSTRLAAL